MTRSRIQKVAVAGLAVAGLALAGCSSSGGSSSKPPATGHRTVQASPTTSVPVAPPTTVAPNLLTTWCSLSIGESKADVLNAMGAPHGTAAADYIRSAGISGDTAEWDGVNGDILLASFTNGTVSNLQAYDGSVGPVGAQNIACPAFRHSS